jgi:4-amino-4-deoxy-L-arabinose transferase-like glycosyltransferase
MKKYAWPILLATAAANIALTIPPPHPLRYLAALSLLWVLPGLAWALLLARYSAKLTGDETLVGLGLGLTCTTLLTLLLHYLPGKLDAVPLLIGSDAHVLVVMVFALRRPPTNISLPDIRNIPKTTLLSALALFLITATLRFANLGYSEFQGDEGVIMVRAAQALEGDDDALFLHQKGPVEILLPMSTWRLAGTIDEFWARAPVAWAGLLGVLAVAQLGRRMFGAQSGWLAGWLLAISGYHVAFGRIVQYQSVVLLATATALLALWLWNQDQHAPWLPAAAALLALGGLSHYDAIMALPPALYILSRVTCCVSRVASYVLRFTFYVLLILAVFYLPYALSPNFGKTVGYLSGERIGSGGPIYDNLGSSFVLTTVYNSTWYVAGLVILLVGVSLLAHRGRARLLPLALVAIALLAPGPLVPFLALALWLGLVIFSRHTSPTLRVAWLWFGASFLFYHFLVWDPRTHVLNLFPGACLLAGKWINLQICPKWRVLGLLPLCLVSYYPFWMFVDHQPEVLRTWPEHKHVLFPTVYDEIPPFGLFGFPHRAGWKAVGALLEAGQFSAPYASNEEVEVTGWYTRGAERTYCPGPGLYVTARQVQDEMPLDQADLQANYGLAASIDRGGDSMLQLYTPAAPAAPLTYWLCEYTGAFDANTTPKAVLPAPPRDYTPVGTTLGDQIRLLGYRLDQDTLAPGDTLELTLYWEALEPLEQSYHVFTHLYRDGQMWGQADGLPQCGLWPTLRWQPGEIVADRYRLTLRPDTPAGEVPLTVGMYTLPDGERLDIYDEQGELLGDALVLKILDIGD